MPTIGEQIRAARKAKGMTQSELASAVNVTRTGISKWETDDRVPDAEMLLHLSEVLEWQFTRSTAESGSGAEEETGEPDKEKNKEEPAGKTPEPPERTAEPAEVPAPSPRRSGMLLRICGAVLALMVLVAAVILLTRPKDVPPEENPTEQAAVFTDGSGKEYTRAEFETLPSADASLARLAFRNSLRFTGEGTDRHIFFEFGMYEESGIALHMDRIDLVLFYTGGTVSVDSFTADDIAGWGDSPDIAPHGSYTMTGGTDFYNSRGEVDSVGAGVKVYCTDAGNHPLVFTSYIPFPAE